MIMLQISRYTDSVEAGLRWSIHVSMSELNNVTASRKPTPCFSTFVLSRARWCSKGVAEKDRLSHKGRAVICLVADYYRSAELLSYGVRAFLIYFLF